MTDEREFTAEDFERTAERWDQEALLRLDGSDRGARFEAERHARMLRQAAAMLRPPSAGGENTDRTFWVLERSADATVKYWSGLLHGWVTNIDEAIQYCRRDDAIHSLDEYMDAKAVEHAYHASGSPSAGGGMRDALWRFLSHGDDEHKRWLREAIDAFYDGKPRPPVRAALSQHKGTDQ